MSYGEEIEYQRLAFDGIRIWNAWNDEIRSSKPEDLPRGLKPSDLIWNNCGFLRMSIDGQLSPIERATLANLTREGLRQTQFVLGDPEDEKRAQSHFRKGEWEKKSDPFGRKRQGKDLVGVFDSTAGFVEASKACIWAMHLCRRIGVRFVLGEKDGQVATFIKDASGKTVGIRTKSDAEYRSKLLILAGKSNTTQLESMVLCRFYMANQRRHYSRQLDAFPLPGGFVASRDNRRKCCILPATAKRPGSGSMGQVLAGKLSSLCLWRMV